ncbi:hypothetical protein BH11ARM2_BH11ARM2_07100 [soil metagenome]
MTRTRTRHARTLLVIWLGVAGFMTATQGNRSPAVVALNFILALVVVVAIHATNRFLLPRLRRTPLLVGASLSALAYFVAFLGALVFVIWLITAIHDRSLASPTTRRNLLHLFTTPANRVGLAYGYALVLAVAFGVEFHRRIGPGRLAGWMLGRYRNPKEESRVFLFIDLSGSTPLAERLGSVRFSAFLRDFFHELTEPTDETGGEIVSYVGDEAIISWPEKRGMEDANALRCFLLFRERIARHADHYRRQYGEVPRYKAALHLGPVVATEVGERRSELVLHGDALNTTARILGECNALGADLLMSEEIAARLPPVDGVAFEPVGAIALRGKAEPLGLVKAV